MNEKEISIEELVLKDRLMREIEHSVLLQIELNKVGQERDHYKSELEKFVEDKSKHKDKESTKK